MLSCIRHFRHSFQFSKHVLRHPHFYNLVTSKPEEGWFGQPKYQLCSSLWTSHRTVLAVVYKTLKDLNYFVVVS